MDEEGPAGAGLRVIFHRLARNLHCTEDRRRDLPENGICFAMSVTVQLAWSNPVPARTIPRVLAAALAVVAIESSAAPTTYDLVADWNPPNNPNGPWSYRTGDSLLPYQPVIPATGGLGGYAPSPNFGAFLPLFFQPGGTGTDIYVHSLDPGNGGTSPGTAVLVWTAPATVQVDVSGYVYYGHPGLSRSNDISISHTTFDGSVKAILLNDVTSSNVHSDFDSRAVFAFDDLSMTAGDQLRVVFAKSAGQVFGSNTAINMQLTSVDATDPGTSVPEPGALTSLVLGLAGMALTTMRRRRAAQKD